MSHSSSGALKNGLTYKRAKYRIVLIMHPGQQIRRALYLRTDGLTFGIFLTVCLIVVTALSYLPSLVLGPVLEHLMFGI